MKVQVGQHINGRVCIGYRGRPGHGRLYLMKCEACGKVSKKESNAIAEQCRCRLAATNGAWRTPTFKSWSMMIQRCYNVAYTGYVHYGARGITVHPEWRESFVAFCRDVGIRPSLHHSLDRTDNNGSYVPGNVRWSLRGAQQRNKTTTHWLVFQGERRSLVEWAEIVGLSRSTLEGRIRTGWSVSDALTKPVRGYQR